MFYWTQRIPFRRTCPGVKTGAVIDMAAAEDSIRSAVQKAEREAGVAVQSVAVNVSTRSLRSQQLTVQTAFASGEVADRDLGVFVTREVCSVRI